MPDEGKQPVYRPDYKKSADTLICLINQVSPTILREAIQEELLKFIDHVENDIEEIRVELRR